MTKQTTETYQSLSSELEAILTRLQAGELDIDEAMQLYERGTQLVKLLEKQLTTAQNRVTQLQAKLQG